MRHNDGGERWFSRNFAVIFQFENSPAAIFNPSTVFFPAPATPTCRQKHLDLHTRAKIFWFLEIAPRDVATFGPSLLFLCLLFLWLSKFRPHSYSWGSAVYFRLPVSADGTIKANPETGHNRTSDEVLCPSVHQKVIYLWNISFCVSNLNLITYVGCWLICCT